MLTAFALTPAVERCYVGPVRDTEKGATKPAMDAHRDRDGYAALTLAGAR